MQLTEKEGEGLQILVGKPIFMKVNIAEKPETCNAIDGEVGGDGGRGLGCKRRGVSIGSPI